MLVLSLKPLKDRQTGGQDHVLSQADALPKKGEKLLDAGRGPQV